MATRDLTETMADVVYRRMLLRFAGNRRQEKSQFQSKPRPPDREGVNLDHVITAHFSWQTSHNHD